MFFGDLKINFVNFRGSLTRAGDELGDMSLSDRKIYRKNSIFVLKIR
jgi:hypothetical protein